MGFYEIAVVTRAGQAKALGLEDKGHLGVGADADIAIYGVNPEEVDPAREYKKVRRAFKHAAYTIKGGEVVVRDDAIVQSFKGRTMWLDVQTSEPVSLTDSMKQSFREYWTVEYENYPVTDHFIEVSHSIAVKADV